VQGGGPGHHETGILSVRPQLEGAKLPEVKRPSGREHEIAR